MKNKIYSNKYSILLFFIVFVIVGCNSDGPEVEQPEKIYYDQAQKRMNAKNYYGAIESLEAIENHVLFPIGSRLSGKYDLFLIMQTYENSNLYLP